MMCLFIQYIEKVTAILKSICKVLQLKIIYGNKISIRWLNSIRQKLVVLLKGNSKCTVGKFLMVEGPLYIKVEDKAQVIIGDKVFFNHNCSITAMREVKIGNGCNIANNVVIVDHDHQMSDSGLIDGYNIASVEIGDNVWIGANATILKGVHIAEGAVIAAGAVVNCDIPACELWGGVPARKIKSLKV